MITLLLKRTKLIAILLLFALLQLQAQEDRGPIDPDDPTGAIEAQLTATVQSQFGSQYTVGFQVLDSVIAHNGSTSDYSELTDPYGTLKGYILFGADKSEAYDNAHGIMGLYKNGQIIWHSDPIFKGIWGGTFSIRDINNDGKVELLVEWTPGAQMILVRYLWIISWNGSTGTIISQVNGVNGNTTIHASESMFELIASDTVSPAVIRARWPGEESFSDWFSYIQISTFPYITYSWNGSRYGLWPDTRQIPANQFLPANLLTVSVNCRVSQLQDSLSFQYWWKNGTTSRQRMASFALLGVEKAFHPHDLLHWSFLGLWQDFPVAAWEVEHLRKINQCLPPGSAQKGVLLHARGLPGIVRFFIQGSRRYPDFGKNGLGFKQAFEFDFLNGSYVGMTVGPVDGPQPFSPSSFVDTLRSYSAQSSVIGWIKDQLTANKYLGYFNSAKASLQQKDTSGARATLAQALNDVNADSTSNLTSEAYALIRYNTEYLLGQLPKPPSGRK